MPFLLFDSDKNWGQLLKKKSKPKKNQNLLQRSIFTYLAASF